MKHSLKYLKLWQRKRSELQINDDQQNDWLEMQSALDKHMPVSGDDEGSSGSKGFKILPLLLISLSAAAITYVVSTKIVIKNHDHKTQHYKVRKHHARNSDGTYRDSITDSLTANSMTLNKKDTISLNGQPIALKNAVGGSGGPTSKADSVASHGNPAGEQSAQLKNNKQSALNAPNKSQAIAGSSYKNQSTLAVVMGGKAIFGSGRVSSSSKSRGSDKNNTTVNSQAANYKNGNDHGNNHNRNNSPSEFNEPQSNRADLLVSVPKVTFGLNNNGVNTLAPASLSIKPIQNCSASKQSDNRKLGGKEKNVKVKNPTPSNLNIDWGILTGGNTSGSFTAKSQNSNFYGSSPVDLFFGIYATYNIGDKWGINSQVRLFSPQTIATVYTHPNQSKIDSNQSLQITSSRKIYSINIPLHGVYKVNDNLSLMAGPVINIPVKQTNTNTTFQPAAIKSDSVFYPKVLSALNGTKYEQKVNFGLSGGVNIQIRRFSIGATYMKSLSGYQVSSSYGNYKSYNGTFQFTIGFQLNKLKP